MVFLWNKRVDIKAYFFLQWFAVHVFVFLFCSAIFICSTLMFAFVLDFACVFDLQYVSFPNGNVVGRCGASALVSHCTILIVIT